VVRWVLTGIVERRVVGHRGQQRVVAAEPLEHRRPQLVGVGHEDVAGLEVGDDPVLLVELALELAGPPPRVPGEDAAAAQRLGDLLGVAGVGRHEAEVAVDDERGAARVLELRQDDDRRRGHRPADVDELVGGHHRHEVGHDLLDAALRRPVEHEPHRPRVAVLRDEHDGAPEVRVHDPGGGDHEAAAQRLHGRRMPG
jgi:hypothetical protein